MNISVYQRSIFLGQTTRQLLFILGLLACVTVCTPVAYAQMLPPSAPPLPAPTGQVISVSTVSELQAAVNGLASGQTILIQPGTYRLTQELRFRFGVTNVALRGATNNRDDVVILGSGMGTQGVNIAVKVEDAQDVLLANFSVGQAYWHPIQLKGEMGAERVHIYNVRLFDAGQQFLKSTVDFNNPNGVDGVTVEYLAFRVHQDWSRLRVHTGDRRPHGCRLGDSLQRVPQHHRAECGRRTGSAPRSISGAARATRSSMET